MSGDSAVHRLLLIPWHIGDGGDVTLNAVRACRRLRVFLAEEAEDTRWQFQEVLKLDCARKEILTVPLKRDEKFLKKVLAALKVEDVGLVSSGGAPCFVDPGAWLVAELRARKIPIRPLAGASTLATLLSLSGLDFLPPDSFSFLFFGGGGKERLTGELLGRRRDSLVIFLGKSDFEDCLRGASAAGCARPVTAFFDLTKTPKSKFPYADRVETKSCEDWLEEARKIRWAEVSDVSLLFGPEGSAR